MTDEKTQMTGITPAMPTDPAVLARIAAALEDNESAAPWIARAFQALGWAQRPSIDVEHIARQAGWSERTFGPGTRHKGVVEHINKELVEAETDPTEWVDVIILALDGAWRAGLTPLQIIEGVRAKQTENEGRQWPDWRTADPDRAIEHVRSSEPEPVGLCIWEGRFLDHPGRYICDLPPDAFAHAHSATCPPEHEPSWECHTFQTPVTPVAG